MSSDTSTLFIQLIQSYRTAALQHLGKIRNVFSFTIEKNLEQARVAIDMLDMLYQKTSNNRTEQEDQLLTDVLRELRLMYVQESQTGHSDEQSKPESNPSPSDTPSPDDAH